ncbi:unnamed protein product [marine sediment metagenome]|uniref:Uncharacterized protein n=1 Tax=marine sediment metagenome TaxID=412755 RepID=X1HXU6_9ZZZZ
MRGISNEKNKVARANFWRITSFQFAKDFGYQESPEGYLSKCHLCLDLRKHLVSKKEFEELTPKEFYLHLE